MEVKLVQRQKNTIDINQHTINISDKTFETLDS